MHRILATTADIDAGEILLHLFSFRRRIAKVITGQRERERENHAD